jgi:hypothetical protein
MTITAGPRRAAVMAPILAMLLALAAGLAGCSPDKPRQATTPTPGGIVSLTAGACRTYTHAGRQVGITFPAGSTVYDYPHRWIGPGASDINFTLENLVGQATLPAPGGTGALDVMISLFAYGPNDLRDAKALSRAVDIAVIEAAGTYRETFPATATTAAGLSGLTGSLTDPKALAANGSGRGVVRYWQLTSSDTQIILVLVSRTPDLDTRHGTTTITGLHPTGCP